MIDRKTRVLTPGVYAPPGKWAVRPMSYLEVLLSKDVSEPFQKSRWNFPWPPTKFYGLYFLKNAWCAVLGLYSEIGTGGANIWRNEKRGRDTGKSIGSEALHDTGSEALHDSIGPPKDTRLAIPQVAKRSLSRESVVDVEPQKLEPGKGELAQEASPGAKKSRTRGVGVDEVKLTKRGPERVKPGDDPPPLDPPSKRRILDKISRDLREKKAVKADGAAISEYLWEDHLVDDDVCEWSPLDQVGLPRAMDLLRGRMLRWWKKRVTTSYLSWMKKEHPPLGNRKF
jgi:hypothetical protein